MKITNKQGGIPSDAPKNMGQIIALSRKSSNERRQEILDLIASRGRVLLSDLTNDYNVSPVTIHRDFEFLVKAGLIERFRGGATSLGSGRRTVMNDWTHRLQDATQAKAIIARHAVQYILDGTTIFLDASTTCLALAYEIENAGLRALTLVTNSPAIAHQLKAENIHLISCPGEVDQTLGMVGGPWTNEFLEKLNFASCFFSAAGITSKALSSSRPAIVEIMGAVTRRSVHSYCLIDSSKFGHNALLSTLSPTDVDVVIVDYGISRATEKLMIEKGINLEIAGARQSEDGDPVSGSEITKSMP